MHRDDGDARKGGSDFRLAASDSSDGGKRNADDRAYRATAHGAGAHYLGACSTPVRIDSIIERRSSAMVHHAVNETLVFLKICQSYIFY